MPYNASNLCSALQCKQLVQRLGPDDHTKEPFRRVAMGEGAGRACTSQMAVVASKLAVARLRPSGDQLQERMVRWCVSSRMAVHTHVSLRACLAQMRTVLSPLQVASRSPAIRAAMVRFAGVLRRVVV